MHIYIFKFTPGNKLYTIVKDRSPSRISRRCLGRECNLRLIVSHRLIVGRVGDIIFTK